MVDAGDDRPHLVMPDGARVAVADGTWAVGREVDADVRLADPTVGRRHATLEAAAGSVSLTDLHSTNGTWVNDHRLAPGDPHLLHDGDRLRLGAAELRFVAPATLGSGGATTVVPLGPPGAQPDTPAYGVPQLTAGDQHAEQLNNVMGNQYNQYLKSVVEQRDSFLRDIAASRTRARRLIWLGFLLFVGGAGAFGWMIIRFISRTDQIDLDDRQAFDEVWGDRVGGIPIGFLGFAVAGVGSVVMIIGIVMHVVATSRRRRVVAQPVLPSGIPFDHFPVR